MEKETKSKGEKEERKGNLAVECLPLDRVTLGTYCTYLLVPQGSFRGIIITTMIFKWWERNCVCLFEKRGVLTTSFSCLLVSLICTYRHICYEA